MLFVLNLTFYFVLFQTQYKHSDYTNQHTKFEMRSTKIHITFLIINKYELQNVILNLYISSRPNKWFRIQKKMLERCEFHIRSESSATIWSRTGWFPRRDRNIIFVANNFGTLIVGIRFQLYRYTVDASAAISLSLFLTWKREATPYNVERTI